MGRKFKPQCIFKMFSLTFFIPSISGNLEYTIHLHTCDLNSNVFALFVIFSQPMYSWYNVCEKKIYG